MANNADAMGLAAGHFRTAASSAPAYWQNPKKPMTPQQIDFLARQGRKIARLRCAAASTALWRRRGWCAKRSRQSDGCAPSALCVFQSLPRWIERREIEASSHSYRPI